MLAAPILRVEVPVWEMVALLVILVIVVIHYSRRSSPRTQFLLAHSAFKECQLSELSFRILKESDFDFCSDLYRKLIEANLAPSTYESEFPNWLMDPSVEKWVISSEGERLSFCGLSRFEEHNNVSLSYGLLDLAHRNKGLGSLALALRLLFLAPEEQPLFISMMATDHSKDYYLRFGFEVLDRSVFDAEEKCPDLHPLGVYLRPEDRSFLSDYLAKYFDAYAMGSLCVAQ